MNARFVSICLSLTGLMIAASTDALGGGMGGGGMGGSMGGSMGGYGRGAPVGAQRGPMDSAPIERESDRTRGASADRPQAERQDTRQSAATQTSELLQQNPKLADNVAKLLPAGTDLQSAASGFKNLGEFVAAVHVSNNLGIPFADLKAKILGGESLGGAIQALRPEADGLIEARKARARAEDDLTKS